jgi:hypothetical protein
MNRIRNEKYREKGRLKKQKVDKIEERIQLYKWKVNCGSVRKEGTRSGGRDGKDVE